MASAFRPNPLPPAAASAARGTSLVEVALAIVVVAILAITVFTGIVASHRMMAENIHEKNARDVATGIAETLEHMGVPDPVPAPYSTETINGTTYTSQVNVTREGTAPREYYVVTITVLWGLSSSYEMQTIVGVTR